ncbi:hypothetical protein L9F63_015480 [Diploptera punctata]|uniref:Alcohol dehydrogenase n=1 Tax=Diploptera punctata TaxID=6984 RepID=A0AAD8A5H6_DIPPU|nr:hypothetical protein L9F63_015480 [Diploptera punctata]
MAINCTWLQPVFRSPILKLVFPVHTRGLYVSNTQSSGDCKRPTRQQQGAGGIEKELMSLDCKVAIVTGGATGIGFSATCHLLKAGARHVIINGPDKEEGESAVEQLEERYGENKVTFVRGDVNNCSHFEGLFEMAKNAYGGVDIVFNNAGILNDKMWEIQVDTNIKGVIRGTLLAFKHMGKDNCGKGGVVINSASIVGLQTLAGAPIYSATKYGVIGSILNFGHKFHYERTGIRVCGICPGVTDTELISGAYGKQLTPEWNKEATRELSQLPKQSPDFLGQGLVYIVRYAPSGSVWIVEDSKILRVHIPELKQISKLVTKFD